APVLLHDVEVAGPKGRADATAKYPGFSVCTERKDGQRSRREFAVMANIVRFAGERPCEALTPFEPLKAPAPVAVPQTAQTPAPETLLQRVKRRLKGLTKGSGGK